MRVEFDLTKNARNLATRNLPFLRAADFDFATARIWQDTRKLYPDVRMLALGYLDKRLHVLCFKPLATGIRVISFHKANQREGEKHGFTLTRD